MIEYSQDKEIKVCYMRSKMRVAFSECYSNKNKIKIFRR